MDCNDQNETATIVQGEDKTLYLRVVDKLTQDPLDLTNASQITARFKNADASVLSVNLSSGVAIVAATSGKISVSLTLAQTALLLARENQSFEIEITMGTGSVAKLSVVQFIHALSVRSRVV